MIHFEGIAFTYGQGIRIRRDMNMQTINRLLSVGDGGEFSFFGIDFTFIT
jgi:hypothetical protein